MRLKTWFSTALLALVIAPCASVAIAQTAAAIDASGEQKADSVRNSADADGNSAD